jgi:hypothetical protein
MEKLSGKIKHRGFSKKQKNQRVNSNGFFLQGEGGSK